jgi:protein O-GlcNAc transferase
MLRKVVSSLLAGRRRQSDSGAADIRAALEAGVEHAKGKRLEAAEACYLEVLRLAPRNPDALNLLGLLALDRTHYDVAAEYFREAVRERADVADFQMNLGLALQALGDDNHAEAAFRRAVDLEPRTLRFSTALLFHLGQRSGAAPESLLAEHRACMGRLTADVRPIPAPSGRLSNPDRRLRIGYVSGDFRAHAVAYFIMPLLAARDRNGFEVFCYHTLDDEDERTARMRELADHWHCVWGLTDAALAALIQSHEIDILVDLAGLTHGNRLRVIARRPAPIQISYLGYLGTTGLDAIDFRITDERADPAGTERWYSERLVRLPESFWCFEPPEAMPEPLPRDAAADGPIVFGSFNRLTKVRPEMLRLWARLLAQVPGSELWLADVPSDERQAELVAGFAEVGVAGDRIRTWERLPPRPYWDLIRRADIALDTFPYNGGATTCECLWLGVPVVTRAGAMGFARSGASILGAAGLSELVADSDDQYVALAAGLAADRVRLRALQAGLRGRLRASALLDAPGFMRNLEGAYRDLWRCACEAAGRSGN